jgi:hypothetical protein
MTEGNRLGELAERIESATAEEHYALLSEAHYLIAGGTSLSMSLTSYRDWLHINAFGKLLDVGAFLDAAMSLVPEGWFWRVGHSTLYAGWASTNRLHPDHCNREDETFAKAATPALALCAAALRARGEGSLHG